MNIVTSFAEFRFLRLKAYRSGPTAVAFGLCTNNGGVPS